MDDTPLISNIFSIFPMVRYTTIWENNEKTQGGMRKDVESYFGDEDEKSSIIQQINRWNDDDASNSLGSNQYSLIVKDKVKLYTINLTKKKFLMVSTEPDEKGDGLVNSILELNNLN
jgi:methionine aminopeptidase